MGTFFAEVLSDQIQLATTSLTLKVQEDDEKDDDRVKLVVPTAALTSLPAPTLRITMTTRDY